ncbi:MAG: thioredoxin family protein [Leptolyngbya sp. SIO1D8]|nr:thioredoxin family protein [Leptolyngbya sp. SIO1D8]
MKHWRLSWGQQWLVIGMIVILSCLSFAGAAWAGLNDDRYDGNMFALYAGNGSLVPPRITLAQSLRQEKPALLMFYVDDSSDCKQFSSVISQLQAPYGRAASFVPIMADSIRVKDHYEPTEPGYYFTGSVPQTVVLDEAGTVRLNETGYVNYETIDDVMREVFGLLPRSESVELRRRPVNELNTELVGS